MVLGEGEHHFVVASADLTNTFACVTCERPGVVEIEHRGELVDRVHLSPGGTHTWWTNGNPLLVQPRPRDHVVIRVPVGATMRVEWPLEPDDTP